MGDQIDRMVRIKSSTIKKKTSYAFALNVRRDLKNCTRILGHIKLWEKKCCNGHFHFKRICFPEKCTTYPLRRTTNKKLNISDKNIEKEFCQTRNSFADDFGIKRYSAFHRFGQTKIANGGLVLGLS